MNFNNRTALIAGGTGALGSAVTRAFLHSGASVVTTYRGEASWQELQNAWAGEKARLAGLQTDVTERAATERVIAQALSRFGKIDVLVHLVGGFAGGTDVAELAEAEWDRMMNLNLKSTFLMCRAVLPHMLQNNYGRIVTTASRAALEVGAGAAAYTVSKAGVLALTKAIAQEVKGKNISVNAVLPGVIDTQANRQAMPQAAPSKFVNPESIAQLILFLASTEAGDINGAAVPIYGAS